MKKILLAGFCGLIMLLVLVHDSVLLSRRRWLETPRLHKVQKGESLSKLAKEHYGEAGYWRELALVNRAPNPDHLEPEEQILLPAASVIVNLRKARTITGVNTLVEQQQLLAQQAGRQGSASARSTATATSMPVPAPEVNHTPVTEPAPMPAPQRSQPEPDIPQSQPEASGDRSWFWLILGLVLLGGLVAFVFYRRRQEGQAAQEQREQEGLFRRRPTPVEEAAGTGENPQNFPNDRRSLMLRKNAAVDTTA
ncbi:MAG: LysM domain-containing protein [candidate division KSB1 bacterium]|nr:LysM domain-containing protein [candidate division KSB1 bacterium]MDZ7273362.1 LysM domain-containing protein [candidate division KSB1 bacterium]MDZ7288024.1 LysM domain-containing protein [candidate division KSB1 bacterium]MDZ7300124.1 LysM domain-containing protein [candidate division KSB1 bacterium]MDZ7308884.1 LysM domain-containing protein [candidate division KSB1 bacterium]